MFLKKIIKKNTAIAEILQITVTHGLRLLSIIYSYTKLLQNYYYFIKYKCYYVYNELFKVIVFEILCLEKPYRVGDCSCEYTFVY